MVVTLDLYDDFLENALVYDAVQMMWQDVFNDFSLRHDFYCRPSYINIYLSNGEKERDANPIFSAMVEKANRGIRILQTTKEEARANYISGYFDTFKLKDSEKELEELVIDLVLSNETKTKAVQWIKAWLVDEMSKEQLNAIIDRETVLVE